MRASWRQCFVAVGSLVLLALAGCETPKPPPPCEYILTSPYSGLRTLAVAPVINQSGSRDFDPLAVSDTLFAELQQVRGLNVLPLNKTLAAMQRSENPDHRFAADGAAFGGGDGR